MLNQSKFLKMAGVVNLRGACRAKIYLDINDGLYPPPIKVGVSSYWPEHEVIACNEAIIAGLTKDEMRAFVSDLVNSRINKQKLRAKYTSSSNEPNAMHAMVAEGEAHV